MSEHEGLSNSPQHTATNAEGNRLFMSAVESYSDAHVAEYCFNDNCEAVTIFLNEKRRPRNIFDTWDFEIRLLSPWGDDLVVHAEEDTGSLCDCQECQNFGSELLDYYSLHNALTWLEEKGRNNIDVNILTDSEKMLSDASDGFCAYGNRYECPFLKILEEDLARFAQTFVLRRHPFHAAKKEAIR